MTVSTTQFSKLGFSRNWNSIQFFVIKPIRPGLFSRSPSSGGGGGGVKRPGCQKSKLTSTD